MAQALIDPEVFPQPALEVVPDIQLTEEAIAQFWEDVEREKQLGSFDEPPKLLNTEEFVGRGYVERYGFRDQKGFNRAALIGIPDRAETDVPVLSTTAWWTSTEGHNLHTGLKFLENGIPFIIVGAEGSYHSGWNNLNMPTTGISLTNSANSMLAFSQFASTEHKYLIHETDRELIGESRSGMTAIGALALAKLYGQNITMTDITAPCFPSPLSLQDAWKFKNQLLAEPRTMIGLAGKLASRLLVHYPQTIDLNPSALMHQLAITPALLHGETGELGALVEGDPILHVTCFDDDYASMPDVWATVLKIDTRRNIDIRRLPGSHLTIADPETLRFLIARNKAYRLIKESGVTAAILQFPTFTPPDLTTELSGPNVFSLAHQFVDDESLIAA